MSFLMESFKNFGSKNAIIFDEKTHSYFDLLKQIEAYLKALELNEISSKVVAVLGEASFENIAMFFALYLKNNIIVPITSPLEKVQKNLLEESFAEVLIDTNEKLKIEHLLVQDSHEIIDSLKKKNHSGLILFSSGSTGAPKAMIHDLVNLLSSYEGKKEKNINMLLFLMFDHIGGLNTLFNALSTGACLVIPKKRDAKEICQLIEKYEIKVLPSSPTFLNLILISGEHEKHDLSSLRMITYGTETMPESLLKKLKENFPRIRFLQTFGTSETGINSTSSKSSDSLFMKIDDLNCEYKIVKDELWLKSKTQVLGYLNASMDSFSSDGWFKTGDLVELSDDGYIKIIGRAKEVINVGGEKVLPSEVESVILQMEGVEDVMAYGEKNAITGQSVVCDVVLKKDIKNIKRAVRLFCKDKLEPFKIPTKVNIVDKTNFGDRFKKIRKR